MQCVYPSKKYMILVLLMDCNTIFDFYNYRYYFYIKKAATFSLIEISDCLYFCQKLLTLMTFLIHLSLFYYVYNKLFFKCRN